jgi:hypothetical protein
MAVQAGKMYNLKDQHMAVWACKTWSTHDDDKAQKKVYIWSRMVPEFEIVQGGQPTCSSNL